MAKKKPRAKEQSQRGGDRTKMAGTTGEGDWKGTGQTGGIYCLPRQQARAWIVLRRRTQHERVHDGSIGNKGGWAIKSRIATKMRKREKEGIKNRLKWSTKRRDK